MTRIIIFTGKGGVGKTSVAAATAWRSAQMHCRTLLVSTDMAHNLGDLFEHRIGRETVQLSEYLDALAGPRVYYAGGICRFGAGNSQFAQRHGGRGQWGFADAAQIVGNL